MVNRELRIKLKKAPSKDGVFCGKDFWMYNVTVTSLENRITLIRNGLNATVGEWIRRREHRLLDPAFGEMDEALKIARETNGRIVVLHKNIIDEGIHKMQEYDPQFFQCVEDLSPLFVSGYPHEVNVLANDGRILASMTYPSATGHEMDVYF